MTERPQPGVSSACQRGAQRVYGLLCLTYKRTLSRPRVSAPLQGRPCTWTRQAWATWWLTSVLSSTERGSEWYSGSQGLSNAWHHLPAGRLRPALLASWTHACHHFPRRRLLFTAQVASLTGPLLSCVIPPGLQVLPIEQRQQGATVPLGWPTVSLPDSTQEKHCSSQERHAGPPWRVPKPPAACAVMSVACAPPSHTLHVSPTRCVLVVRQHQEVPAAAGAGWAPEDVPFSKSIPCTGGAAAFQKRKKECGRRSGDLAGPHQTAAAQPVTIRPAFSVFPQAVAVVTLRSTVKGRWTATGHLQTHGCQLLRHLRTHVWWHLLQGCPRTCWDTCPSSGKSQAPPCRRRMSSQVTPHRAGTPAPLAC